MQEEGVQHAFGQEERLFKTALCMSSSVPCSHPACGITSLWDPCSSRKAVLRSSAGVNKANQRKLEASATKPTYITDLSCFAMANTHRPKTPTAQNPAFHLQIPRSQGITVALGPRDRESQTRLPCSGWQNCFCKCRAIQAGMKRTRFADIRSLQDYSALLAFSPNRISSRIFSDLPKTWPAHRLWFHSQNFFLQSYSSFPEQGRTV